MTRRPPSSRRGMWQWAALLGLLVVMLQPCAAFAHASLIASEPLNEAVVPAAPDRLTLTFNEPVTPLVMRLIDRSGSASELTRIERRGASLVLAPPAALTSGAYVLSWRVMSEDGHPVGGALTFWIGERDAPPPEMAGVTNRSLKAGIWMMRFVIYLGLFAGVGGAFFVVWMQMPPSIRAPRRAIAATNMMALAALAVAIGLQGLDARGAPWSALMQPAVWTAGLQGSFGLSMVIAAASLAIGLLSLTLRWARTLSLGALLGVGVALAATGHAASAEPRILTMAAVFLHGVSLAFWIGALLPLASVLANRDEAARGSLIRFSRWIPFSIAALLASGGLLATIQLQHLDALWTTDYGRVLLAKLALVSLLLALALANRLVLTPRWVQGAPDSQWWLRRSIIAELALVVLVLGAVGLWRFTPPPRLLVAVDDSFFTHIHTDKAMANVTISPARAGLLDIAVQLETSDEQPLTAKALSVSLSNPDLGIEPIMAEARLAPDGLWRVHMAASVAGRWSLGLGILISDFEKVSVAAPIQIK